jgi:predicted amidohydrolase
MQVVCCQLNIVWENKPTNYATVRSMLATADPAAGALVVLPEMFSTGFSMNVAGIAEGVPSETVGFLSDTARAFGVWLIGGVVTVGADGRGRNEAVVVDPSGDEVARYQKIHPFTFGEEGEHYSGGDAVTTFDWHGVTVAPFICYDLRFPEAFRVAVKRGAQLFPVIANWPAAREAHWIALLRARAIENQAYVVGVNRCGEDPVLAYSGRSLIVDPQGEIVADVGNAAGILKAEIDPEVVTAWRARFPALRDMRFAITRE